MPEQNPSVILAYMAADYCIPRCLHVIADLGVADALDEVPRPASELAAAVGANADALARVLRLLAGRGVFEMDGDLVSHTAASRLLRSDHPHSMRAFVQTFGSPVNWKMYEELEYTLRTGQPAADKVVPEGMWAYRESHPEENRIFNAAMVDKSRYQIAGVVGAYDFARFHRIGDIGGGHGQLLRAVLDAAPRANGVLFDLPHVIAEVEGLSSERLALQSGDFFRDPLPACDAYLLMEVIHDWADAESIAILKAIRQAAPSHATLLIIETILCTDPGPDWAKTLDIHMLTWLGGRQRTRQEYETLLHASGFELQREIDTNAGVSILEAGIAPA